MSRYYAGIFFALVTISILQVIIFYPQTPAVVASHFDGLGMANGWSSRNGFFGLYLAIIAMLVGVFHWLPSVGSNRSVLNLKVPNPEYWLAPERLEETRLFFRRQMSLIGILHLTLAILTVQLVIQANFQQTPQLHSGIFWILGLYFLLLLAWLLHFYVHFRKP
ncbi:MAG: DUF1648 domain-containing protein [Pseudomonadota bacterium]